MALCAGTDITGLNTRCSRRPVHLAWAPPTELPAELPQVTAGLSGFQNSQARRKAVCIKSLGGINLPARELPEQCCSCCTLMGVLLLAHEHCTVKQDLQTVCITGYW